VLYNEPHHQHKGAVKGLNTFHWGQRYAEGGCTTCSCARLEQAAAAMTDRWWGVGWGVCVEKGEECEVCAVASWQSLSRTFAAMQLTTTNNPTGSSFSHYHPTKEQEVIDAAKVRKTSLSMPHALYCLALSHTSPNLPLQLD